MMIASCVTFALVPYVRAARPSILIALSESGQVRGGNRSPRTRAPCSAPARARRDRRARPRRPPAPQLAVPGLRHDVAGLPGPAEVPHSPGATRRPRAPGITDQVRQAWIQWSGKINLGGASSRRPSLPRRRHRHPYVERARVVADIGVIDEQQNAARLRHHEGACITDQEALAWHSCHQ